MVVGSFESISQTKKLFGKIANEKEVEGIHVLNTSSRFYAISNESGSFSISVNPQDTLLISSINFLPEEIVVTPEIYKTAYISIVLKEQINELSEVFVGARFTGDLEKDIAQIPVVDSLDFYDVGIPGFRGTPEEKIPNMLGGVIAPTAINIEGLYKHLSGYYKRLRTLRKWKGQDATVSRIIHYFGEAFFWDAYGIPKEKLEDFLLYCLETSTLQQDFNKGNNALVLTVFSERSLEYIKRISEKKE
ncbi:MAG: hypothetical protein CMC74_11325 [Flavobacteriaceae bacterium]|nr:hypothetical protein [Flavobacteriaceae bacterium]